VARPPGENNAQMQRRVVMTDSVQEHENAPESAHILARIAQVLKENPENGLETVREAFEAERERAQKALREHAQDFDSLKEVRLGLTPQMLINLMMLS